MGNKKLLHMPTGLVINPLYNNEGIVDFKHQGIRGWDNKKNFKPLSEFNGKDLRDGDTVSYRCASTGYIGGGYIRIPNQPSNTLYLEKDVADNFNHRGISDFDIIKVTRNGEVIWEREEKSEVQQIIDKLCPLIKPSGYQEANELLRRLEAIEAERGAE